MRPLEHRVELEPLEREHLLNLIATGKAAARTLMHARVLLKADHRQEGGPWPDDQIAHALEIGSATVARLRKRFAQQGLDATLRCIQPVLRSPRKMDGDAEAHLIALTCGAPPEGHKRWTLRLLANGMVEAGYVDALSHEAVRKTLKKTNLSLG